ncbi:MAG: TerB N-terminal domain-containing protein [Desulfovibrio sp.]|nr:TerB N-terminal domain-containing protein [Desulfovibrio sp.]
MDRQAYTLILENKRPNDGQAVYQETPLEKDGALLGWKEKKLPSRIRLMQRMFDYGDGSFEAKCRNFYLQGKMMEDYKDNEPWDGPFEHYFPTYHDLNGAQLRGYFTWRTRIRNGDYQKIATSLAYIYLYELVNGIGTRSIEEQLSAMQAFEKGYVDSGYGDESMRKNMHRWLFDLSVMHALPKERVRGFADKSLIQRDDALLVLQKASEHSDEEIVSALMTVHNKKSTFALLLNKAHTESVHLIAQTWRLTLANWKQGDTDLFTACFGEKQALRWHPLGNALYWEKEKRPDTNYCLSTCRSYAYLHGIWYENAYDRRSFDEKRFSTFLSATDCLLRNLLKIGKKRDIMPCEMWAEPSVLAALSASQEQKSCKTITVNLDTLPQIREEAFITCERLLTDEEREEASQKDAVKDPDSSQKELDAVERRILHMLLEGDDTDAFLKEKHILPSLVADSINEAFFKAIGDSILGVEDDTLFLIEDYKDDVHALLRQA